MAKQFSEYLQEQYVKKHHEEVTVLQEKMNDLHVDDIKYKECLIRKSYIEKELKKILLGISY